MIKLSQTLFGFILVGSLTACQGSSSSGGDDSNSSGRRSDGSIVEAHSFAEINRPSGQQVLKRSLPHVDDKSISYCESVGDGSQQYNGFRDTTKYPLASVSKVFLSAWVLDRLGPDYKFEHRWFLNEVDKNQGLYDAFYQANYDPATNIEKMLYGIAMMNFYGVKKIRNLVIDSSTRVYLSVLNNPHIELDPVPVTMAQSVENLNTILNSQKWGAQTGAAKEKLRSFLISKGSKLSVPSSFSVSNVTYKTGVDVSQYSYLVSYKSANMLKYLKDINVNSNNYMSDAFFNLLGGASAFKTFQVNRLKLNSQDLEFYTGSGLPSTAAGYRADNKGSCVSVLQTLKFVDELSQQLNFNLGKVLLTAGSDNGTYDATRGLALNQNIVLKTGRLYDVPTLNVAGIGQLKSQKIYFSFMAHGFDNNNESIYKNKRDDLIQSLLNYYPTYKGFSTIQASTVLVE